MVRDERGGQLGEKGEDNSLGGGLQYRCEEWSGWSGAFENPPSPTLPVARENGRCGGNESVVGEVE